MRATGAEPNTISGLVLQRLDTVVEREETGHEHEVQPGHDRGLREDAATLLHEQVLQPGLAAERHDAQRNDDQQMPDRVDLAEVDDRREEDEQQIEAAEAQDPGPGTQEVADRKL